MAKRGGLVVNITTKKKSSSKLGIYNPKEILFYSIFIAIPVIHFLVFYVYINFNSIVLAFQKYALGADGYVASSAGWQNFKTAWMHSFGSPEGIVQLKNSLKLFAIMTFGVTPLALFFSYYLYKKAAFSGFFKVILFMPQLLSGVVLGVLFKEIANGVYIKTLGGEGATGLLTNIDTKFGAVIFFNIIMSFGVNVLTYTSTMGGINESLIESAQLDGANALEEFFYIVFPMIYPTVTTLMIVGFSHIFTNQYNLYTLFGQSGNEVSTIGYYLYVQAQSSALSQSEISDMYLCYPVLSAMGLIFTAIVLPLTLLLRSALEKYGPSAE